MRVFLRGVLVAGLAFVATGSAQAGQFAKEFGKSLPPIGFVSFCASNSGVCKPVGRNADHTRMDQKKWTSLYQVNTYVNSKIKPMSDQDLYGQTELWAYPSSAGDCEDYVLLKQRELEKLGFEPGSLLITVVLDERREGHAVLTVSTDAGDYVLDNRRNDILLWKDTGYSFLKRQASRDPRQWVALTESKVYVAGTSAGN